MRDGQIVVMEDRVARQTKGGGSMNPLSRAVLTTARHKRRSLMLTLLLALAVMGLYLVLGVLLETFITPIYTVNRYLSKFSLVQPDMGALDPAVVARIRANRTWLWYCRKNHVEIAVPNAGGSTRPSA